MVRRIKVLGIALFLGAVFSLWTAGTQVPMGLRFSERVFVWASVMGGPIMGTIWGVAGPSQSFLMLGWLGALLVPAHFLKPCVATGCLTMLGFSLWFFAGFVEIILSAWGA